MPVGHSVARPGALAGGAAGCDIWAMAAISVAILLAIAQPTPQAAAPAPTPAAELPAQVVFARTRQDGWRIEAITGVDEVGGLPMIAGSYCEIVRSGLKLTTWREAGLWAILADNSVDPTLDFSSHHIRRVVLDGESWDYRAIRGAWGDRQFVNLTYPPPPRNDCGGRRGHDVILYGCPQTVHSYSHSLRRGPGRPWLGPGTLSSALLRAGRLRIGFQEQDGEGRPTGALMWAEIPLTGLDRAIAWCRSALESEAARRFHGGLEEEE